MWQSLATIGQATSEIRWRQKRKKEDQSYSRGKTYCLPLANKRVHHGWRPAGWRAVIMKTVKVCFQYGCAVRRERQSAIVSVAQRYR